MEKFGIGQAVRRKEDLRFLSGSGRYIDDIKLAHMAHSAVLRSPHAHAHISQIDSKPALEMPGVLAVITGKDIQKAGIGNVPTRTAVNPIYKAERPLLALNTVRFVGDLIAFVVAETKATAVSALERIEVDYVPLPAVVDPVQALEAGATAVWPEAPDNLCVDFELGDRGAVDAAFDSAAHIVTLNIVNNRVTAVPIEPRGAIGEYHPDQDCYTLHASTQNVHANRAQIASDILHIDPKQLHVVAPDVGGGFGVKNSLYPEYALVLFAAHQLKRPVKWIADRSESFLADTHGREQHSHVQLALSKEGDFLALKVESIGNTGAYLSTVGPFVSSAGSARTQGGPYRIKNAHFHSRVAYTHTAPTDPYRGAGRPEATFVIERVIDVAAQQLGFNAIELRRRNAIRCDELPFITAMGAEIDSGDFPALLERTLELGDWPGFAARQQDSEKHGKLRGRGIGLYFECTGGGPKEYAAMKFSPDGSVDLAVGSHSTGMGHETAMAQIVNEQLGIAFDKIRFHQGDTNATPLGGGHGGSRGLEVGGSAVFRVAAHVREKTMQIASRQLEAASSDLHFANGLYTVVGTDRCISLDEIIKTSFQAGKSALDDNTTFERGQITYPNGCHMAEVEVDPETGSVTVLQYAIVDDFGRIINPLLADGQVIGGSVQGIGQALCERIVYDQNSGQLVSGSLMDYCLPRADFTPEFKLEYYEDAPTQRNPLGVKGAGEAGCVGAPPALVNAVIDALGAYGIQHIDMPLTPQRVWRAIQDARSILRTPANHR